ncbi:MAG: hypothetical protein QXV84_01360 [Conexivisphaerales archaeon]
MKLLISQPSRTSSDAIVSEYMIGGPILIGEEDDGIRLPVSKMMIFGIKRFYCSA